MNTRMLSLAVISLACITPMLAQELPKLMPADLFRRNIGTPEQLARQFPPHKIIDNIYYAGTESPGSFLIATDVGHILVNTDYERTVPTLNH